MLTKQNLDVLFTKGVDNKTNDQLVLGDSLKELENRVFNKLGRADKRNGFDVLSNTDFDDATITNMDALSKFGESELVMFADQSIYSYSPSVGKWQYKDEALSAAVELDKIVDGPTQQQDIDSCHADGVTLFAWTDAISGDIMAAVYDTESKTVLNTTYVVSTTGDSPRCLAVGSNLFVFYCDSTALKYAYVSSSSPTTVTTGTISTTYENVHADHLFDVCAIGNTGYAFYKGTTATTVQTLKFNTAAEVTADATLSATVIDSISLHSFTATDGNSYISLAYQQTTSIVRAAIYTATITVKKAISTIDATASLAGTMITSAYSSLNDTVYYFYQKVDATPSKTFIRFNTIGLTSGTVGTDAVFLRGCSVASRAFTKDGTVYLNILHESTLQATVFTVKATTKNVVCTFAKGRAGSDANIWAPPTVSTLDDGTYSFAMNVKGVIRSENATLFSTLGLSSATIDFNGPYLYNSITLNNNMLAIGGNVLSYDGTFVTEQGFHLFPEGIAQTATATSGGFMSDGAYQYVALYQWVDAKGNIHKSAPSIPITYTVAGGGSTQTVTITVPTLRITQKQGDRNDCTLELYRTEASGEIFYKVTSVLSPTYNDITTDTVAIVDTLADATIISNEILYITGGVLDNIGAPSASVITTYKNRAFIAGLEDKNEIRYSKITRLGEGTAFNEGLSIKCDPRGGDITSLATLDDRLVIFKHSSIFELAGDGPSDTGENATYTEPTLVSTDVGCTDGNSVVLGPDGLFFKSAKGIYLLDRSNTATYIGAPVEDYNDGTVTSAVLLDSTNEIRFSLSTGYILVYNYYFKQWSVFTGNTLDDAIIYNDIYTFITKVDKVLVENSGYKDQGSYVNSKISTGWIRLNGIQGYQRAYRVGVLGVLRSNHYLKVSVYTDYSDTVTQEKVFNVGDIMTVSDGYYGDNDYGSGTYGGTDNGVYQFQVHIKKQKCQSIRFVIEDIYENSSTTNTGQGADITGLTLEVGVKKGQNKLRNERSR